MIEEIARMWAEILGGTALPAPPEEQGHWDLKWEVHGNGYILKSPRSCFAKAFEMAKQGEI